MESGKNVTIYDIAREAGVSVSTVSRVITGNARVKEEKRTRIEELIKRYDFKPNALAKSLRETKSRVIGMILIDFINPFYATLLSCCEKEVSKRGYSLIVSSTVGRMEMEQKYLDDMYEQRVGAIVNVGGKTDEMTLDAEYVEHVNRIANSIPIITTGKLDGADCYQVNLDEMKSSELMLNYLLSLGHRKIAIIGGRSNVRSTMEKRLKYKQLLQKNGIAVREEYIIEGDSYDDSSGYAGMNQLMDLQDKPTAVVGINDFTAIGIVRAALDRGLKIPEDISIASFDDTFIANLCRPRLTSVSYDYELFGRTLIDTAINAMEGKRVKRENKIVPRLVVRKSCMKVKK